MASTGEFQSLHASGVGPIQMRWPAVLIFLIGVAAILSLGGCAAFNPQGAAEQATPSYYNGEQYSQLSPEQKMQLEDHLSNQSNAAWRTTASVAGGLGTLTQGTGVLLWAVKR
ncbi:MAG TPA: hypothetical protein VNF27_04515 [Candidatus Binataceae bacterium]|nr:hypothetical protein [Candidatus Binataceae bacterium]